MTKKSGKASKSSANQAKVPSWSLNEGVPPEVNREDNQLRKIMELIEPIFRRSDEDEDEYRAKLFRAIELYQSLEPADGAEGMLATQMVGTHHAALECLRRAARPNQTFEGRDLALKHAQRFMSLFERQLAALDKHRGKGQQKVTVEHVHVHSGGQAIVGSVEAKRPDEEAGRKTVEHQKSVELPVGEIARSKNQRTKDDG